MDTVYKGQSILRKGYMEKLFLESDLKGCIARTTDSVTRKAISMKIIPPQGLDNVFLEKMKFFFV